MLDRLINFGLNFLTQQKKASKKQAKMFRVGQRTNLVLIEMDCGRNNLKNNNKYKNENEE